MMGLFLLLLVATVITMNTDVVKLFIAWIKETVSCIKDKRFAEIKYGIPVSIGFGLWAGFTVGVSIFTALFDAMGITYELTKAFELFATVSTGLLLTQGSAGVIKLIENYKLQIIEHKAEIKKIKIPLRRLEENLDFVNDEIKSIRNQSTDE